MSEPHIRSFGRSAFNCEPMCVPVHLSGLNAISMRVEHVILMIVLIVHTQLRTRAHIYGGQERVSKTWSPREGERDLKSGDRKTKVVDTNSIGRPRNSIIHA